MRRLFPLLFLMIGLAIGCGDEVPLSLPRDNFNPRISRQGGPIRAFFTRPGSTSPQPDDPAPALAGYIDQAKQTIDVCAYELDNQVIVNALVKAVQRGVKVRLVTETDYLDESGVARLKSVGVPVVDDQRDGALMHNKFMVFDNRSVWMGSMNFTENCANRNNNHGIYLDDARIAANYGTKFQWMFEQRKFGGLPTSSSRIPNPQVVLSDGTRVENYFSTHDDIADRLVQLVDRGQDSLHFLAFSFTHKGIRDAMVARARAGVKVEGVFEKSQAASSYSAYNHLRDAGKPVQVYLDANPRNMHHKAIILDGNVVVAGSFNFSESADKQNDENVVIIHSRAIARQFEQEFQRLYEDARQADASSNSSGAKR